MLFTSFDFAIFLLVLFSCFWLLRNYNQRKLLLLIASYIFYGWNVPWFCLLIFLSTSVNYLASLSIAAGKNKTVCLALCLLVNLGMLALFKYNNFFIDNFATLLSSFGMRTEFPVVSVILPVGISFYTFQSLSYTIDVYRGDIQARRNFVDFALFVSFFPQLVAGPIERAKRLLTQIEIDRKWSWELFDSAWPLIVRGLFKKMVIADNVSVFVDKIFLLEQPGLLLLIVGTFAFSVQIYTDFSGYTDIARGTARLFGFNLMKNFNLPFLAVSPSDFWRRWHISLSTWIRDYVYISFGGNNHKYRIMHVSVIMATMVLSGLWHGAAWNFVTWGGYHGAVLIVYHLLGKGGSWRPKSYVKVFAAWFVMFLIVQFGWLLFRSPDISWLIKAISPISIAVSHDEFAISLYILLTILCYCIPLFLLMLIDKIDLKLMILKPAYLAAMACLIFVFYSRNSGDFIYFQF